MILEEMTVLSLPLHQIIIIIIILKIIIILSVLLRNKSKENKKIFDILIKKDAKVKALNIEINDRVRNSIALLSNSLDLQKPPLDEPLLIKINQSRQYFLGVLRNYLIKNDNSLLINLKKYISDISFRMQNIYIIDNKKFKIETNIDDIDVDGEFALRIAIIINELVVHSIKNTFGDIDVPLIQIDINKTDDIIEMIYRDVGESEDIMIVERGRATSSETRYITLLTNQLNGSYSLIKENGVEYRFEFKI